MSRIPVDVKDMNVGEDKKGELGRKKGKKEGRKNGKKGGKKELRKKGRKKNVFLIFVLTIKQL